MRDDGLGEFERLASLANREPHPDADVTERVLRTLRTRTRQVAAIEPEYVLSGLASLAAACAALTIAWPVIREDPLVALIQPFVTVM